MTSSLFINYLLQQPYYKSATDMKHVRNICLVNNVIYYNTLLNYRDLIGYLRLRDIK